MSGIPFGSAQHHLNHPLLVGAFFGTGMVGFLLSWLLVGYAGQDFIDASLGPGPALAALHAITGLTILPVTIGACFQMLPVLSRTSTPPAAGGWAVFILVVTGQAMLVTGFALARTDLLGYGGLSATTGLALFLALMVPILKKGEFDHFPDTKLATMIALTCMGIAVTLGLLTGLNYELPWLARPDLTGALHGLLMTYGYIGFLVLGFTPFLLQIIALARAPKKREGPLVLGFAATGLILIASGVALERTEPMAIGFLSALAAVALHIRLMQELIHGGMSRKAGISLAFMRLSWGFLVASLAVSFTGMVGWIGDKWLALVMVLTFQGWLFSLILAVLGRILPFLAAMFTVRYSRVPTMVSQIEPARLLSVQGTAYLGAVGLSLAAVIFDSTTLLVIGSLIGYLSGLLLLTFGGHIVQKTLWHHRLAGPKPANPPQRYNIQKRGFQKRGVRAPGFSRP